LLVLLLAVAGQGRWVKMLENSRLRLLNLGKRLAGGAFLLKMVSANSSFIEICRKTIEEPHPNIIT
jgi:hypothetical protein